MAASDNSTAGRLFERQSSLIEMNTTWLRQARALLQMIGDEEFAASPRGLEPHRAGSHLRHVLEFYECFLDGLEGSHVDYDARRRDESIESCRHAAVARIDDLIERLEQAPMLRGDSLLFVRAEDATARMLPDPYLTSSVGRELMVLSSHTVHHFALIAMTLRALGVSLHPDFGMAPSSLRYREKVRVMNRRVEAA